MAEEKTVLLSYRALAARLGISKEAAKSRARRAGWERVISEFGEAEFNVPLSIFEVKGKEYDIGSPHEQDDIRALECTSDALDILRGCVAELQSHLAYRDKEIAMLRARIEELTHTRSAA